MKLNYNKKEDRVLLAYGDADEDTKKSINKVVEIAVENRRLISKCFNDYVNKSDIKPSCTGSCYGCCFQIVSVSIVECIEILSYILKHNLFTKKLVDVIYYNSQVEMDSIKAVEFAEKDIKSYCEKLFAETHYDPERSMSLFIERLSNATNIYFRKKNRCAFLDSSNMCMVYEVRPVNCLTHFVSTEPWKCEPSFNGMIGKLSIPDEFQNKIYEDLDERAQKIFHLPDAINMCGLHLGVIRAVDIICDDKIFDGLVEQCSEQDEDVMSDT